MSGIPANASRVPNSLGLNIALRNVNRVNLALLNTQTNLSSGRAINRLSDDPLRASSLLALNDRIAANAQRERNLEHARAVLGSLSGALGSANDLVDTASNLASDQANLTDSATRASQAPIVSSYIDSLFQLVNDRVSGVHYFGGSTPGEPPMVRVAGGFRYVGRGSGLITDIGLGDTVPITIGGQAALGETSSRQRSLITLSRSIDDRTAITDLRGGRGAGVALGDVDFSFNGGPTASVDLRGAVTMQDVARRLQNAIGQYETNNSVTVLGPGGVTVGATGIQMDIAAGGSLAFSDEVSATTGADLGLTQGAFTDVDNDGGGVNLSPRLTYDTPVGAIGGLTVPLGSIRIRMTGPMGNAVQDVNLSGAQTIDDIRAAIERTNLGVRVEINAAGDGIDIFNEVAGPTMKIEGIPGSAVDTASQLGIRTFNGQTAVSAFNFGRGVEIRDGIRNGLTGTVERSLNTDLRVNLANGQFFDVDLRPEDMVTIDTVVARINGEFNSQLGQASNPSAPPLTAGQFAAGVSAGVNGFSFSDSTGGVGAVTIGTLNNSGAAEQLGLTKLGFNSTQGQWVSDDRAGVRVENVFTHLLALRDALERNDSSGITLAGGDLQKAGSRLQVASGVVGGYDRRVDDQRSELIDRYEADMKIRSSIADVDFTEAATRLSQLNTQLQASLSSIGRTQNQTLFDFLR